MKISDGRLCKDKKENYTFLKINQVKYIKQEIDKTRNELNMKIIRDKSDVSKKEILELSQKLDELIVSYLKICEANYLDDR